MYRFEVILFGLFLLIISFFGISDPHSSFEWLMAAHDGMDALRVSLALILIAFGIFAPRNGEMTNMVFRTASLFMLGLFAGNMLLPDLYRQIDLHIMALDVVALIEGSIVCMLYGAGEDIEDAVLAQGKPSKRSGKRSATHA